MLTEWGTGASGWTADFSQTGSLPVVRADSFSSGVVLSADAFAVEGYTYNGGRSGSFTLSIELDSTLDASTSADAESSLFPQIYVLEEPEEPGLDFPAASGDPELARRLSPDRD